MRNLFWSVGLLFVLVLNGCDLFNKKDEPDRLTKGCGDFYIYKILDDSLIISVRIDHKKIPFSTSYQTFPNVENADFATIELEETCDVETIMNNNCNDVIQYTSCESTIWKLKKGQLKFKVSRVLSEYKCQESYNATVILSDAEFVRDSTQAIRYYDEIEFKNVMVGWCAG